MPKPRTASGEKNIIADKLKELRAAKGMSQRKLADEFQLIGLDVDKNVITRIETQKRYVTDIELCAIMKIFAISSAELLEHNGEPRIGSNEDIREQDHSGEDDPVS